jgi:thermostable 8-oxoguanine DNA glycosylase
LNSIVDKHAQPWMKRYGITDQALANAVTPDWYLSGEKAMNGHVATVKGDY